jgi:hypothetical protein
MFNWLRDLFKPQGMRVDLRLFTYAEADRTLLAGNGEWRIAPEEDHNRRIGYVWLERRVKLNGTADGRAEHE